ncbi:hypothetical protein GCM10011390_03370 [Aureimonas endophytica]|uniref:Uncharacterized protein n=1 Tax=Aureimonas endophytica TaxID=2027858 RepID=A0A917E064_9HYPH|nr:hypothetical protein [Aureimonas endophytica]GGD87943.1 hypothetical protein GCM10011390_03370 [Aureimonas endophytica]
MTVAEPHNLKPTAIWRTSDVAGLARTWLPDIEIVELPDGRWSTSLYSWDVENDLDGCIHNTRAAAIRSQAAAGIRHARDLAAELRSGIETVFSISDEQFRTYVEWLRGIVSREASRRQAAIEMYERGVRRANEWIADQQAKRGLTDDDRFEDSYPASLRTARGKVLEYRAMLAELQGPIGKSAEEEATSVAAEPFAAYLALESTLGASIQIRRLDDFWQARHKCSYGNGCYSIQYHGRFPTQQAAYDHAVLRIQSAARWVVESGESVRVKAGIGEPDVLRAKKILKWLEGLTPPEPDEIPEPAPDAAPIFPAATRKKGRKKAAEAETPIAETAKLVRTSRRLEHYRARLDGCIAAIASAKDDLLDHYLSARDELQAIVDEELGFLSGPPVPPPVELVFRPSKKNDEVVEIVVGEVAPGIWCEGTRISIDNSGYGGPSWSFGKRFATEVEAWSEAIGNLAKNLRDRPRQPESVKKAREWLEGVAAERGVDIDAQLERMKEHLQAVLEMYRSQKMADPEVDAPIADATPPSKLDQLRGMHAEFTRMRDQLDRAIEQEELRTGNGAPEHFAYSTFAKACRKRKADLDASIAKLDEQIAAETAPVLPAWSPPAWVRDAEDTGSNVFAIADALPDKHALAWIDERNRQIRLATATVPPFEACIDFGRNLGASIQIRSTQDGEAWEVAHDCAWGGGGYVAQFRGRYVTRRGAFTVAAKAIRKEATIPIEAAKVKPPVMCVGAEDLRRAREILEWLDALAPPGPDEVEPERAAA